MAEGREGGAMIGDLKPYPAYKDSGVAWLGDVPGHWGIERAKWLFRKMDRPVREQDEVVTCFRDGVVTLRKNRRVRGFTESLKEIGYQGIRRGDLVIHAMDAFAGAIGVANSDGKGTPVYSVCKSEPEAHAQYYAYALREMARSRWIHALATGIRERSTDFRFDDFGSQLVPLPPVAEQSAIARFLDHMDRRIRRYIRTKQKLIKLLDEQKQAIIHCAVTRGLDPNVRLKPSGAEWLGDMPEHWDVMLLGAGTESIQTGPFGSQLHASEYVRGGTPVVNPSHMLDGRIRHDPEVTVDASKAQEQSRHALRAGDIVMARRGDLGRCALAHEAERGWLCGTGSLRVRPRRRVFVPAYLMLLIGSRGVRGALRLSSIGATMDNLSAGMVARLRLPCPPVAEQRRIIDVLTAERDRVRAAREVAQRSISLVREYHTRLLSDVVTGNLDVREAAENLPAETEDVAIPDSVDDVLESASHEGVATQGAAAEEF